MSIIFNEFLVLVFSFIWPFTVVAAATDNMLWFKTCIKRKIKRWVNFYWLQVHLWLSLWPMSWFAPCPSPRSAHWKDTHTEILHWRILQEHTNTHTSNGHYRRTGLRIKIIYVTLLITPWSAHQDVIMLLIQIISCSVSPSFTTLEGLGGGA